MPLHPTTSGRKSPPFWPWPGRSGPPRPTTSLAAAYIASRAITFGGPSVTGWGDDSGHGRNLTGSAAFVANAVNGHPGVNFTGSAGLGFLGVSGISLTGPRMVGGVVVPTSAAGGTIMTVGRASVGTEGSFVADLLTIGGTQYIQSNNNFGDIGRVGAPVDYTGIPLAYVLRWDGTATPASLVCSINGAGVPLASTTPATPDTTTDGIFVGLDAVAHTRDLIIVEADLYASSDPALAAALLAYYAGAFGVP